jgi:hypothetical protein
MPAGERELVCEWLEKGIGHNRSTKATLEQQLLGILTDQTKVDRVFFVWTENLSDPNQLPTTKGLVKFVSWCREGAQMERSSEPDRAASVAT